MIGLAEMAEIAASGLFDGQFYVSQLPESSQSASDALLHFCSCGFDTGLRPNAYFDPQTYLQVYPDVATSGLNPLLHYIRHGEKEGRRPIAIFDPCWYRETYGLPAEAPLLSHFLTYSSQGIVLPCPGAFAFAFTVGLSGRLPPPSPNDLAEVEYRMVAESSLVDSNYYLINGEDVLDAAIDPVRHYCGWGWRERRKPNIYFDTGWYLSTNPDVVRLGVNPLVHYLLVGERAGRRPVPWFEPIWYRSTNAVPDGQSAAGHYLVSRCDREVSPSHYFATDWYVRRHQSEIGAGSDAFAHYLQIGAFQDVAPSSNFDAAEYRRNRMGRVSKLFRHLQSPETSNPLVHKSLSDYLERRTSVVPATKGLAVD